MKNVRDILVVLISIFMFAFVVMHPTLIYARDPGQSVGGYKNELQKEYQKTQGSGNGSGDFDPNDYKPDSTTEVKNGDELAKAGSKIMGTVMSIASVLAVITFSGIGIKYMLGSVEEKAQYKKTLFPYLIGAIMVFGITTVIQIISAVASNMPS